ncbi:MAG: tRNA (adenosine(37)-N6)-threonylcarbamoyltransferase complex ATPase subunit type 1 TsaE [Gammaproteobacteria bacterium]|nr:tRNA (adenosine(37)-N6)-threonylcarbamoyltransferase complex ATPase subunit type 1 TsaE [Gammaproteobacteria bacterium]
MQVFDIPTEDAMLALGKRWARRLSSIDDGAVVFLAGPLGAGKTTLARGILRGMGHAGAVASPTYTLLEHYDLPAREVWHFDLYRLEHPRDVETLGLRDALASAAVVLVEWPERGAGKLPAANYEVEILHRGDARRVQVRAPSGAANLDGLEILEGRENLSTAPAESPQPC